MVLAPGDVVGCPSGSLIFGVFSGHAVRHVVSNLD